jgi:hypothetical protein
MLQIEHDLLERLLLWIIPSALCGEMRYLVNGIELDPAPGLSQSAN